MQCTRCNSDNVQKLSVVYEQGTQNIKTKGRTSGTAIGAGGGGLGVGFGTATTTTTGKSQSIAAEKATPPAKKSFGVAVGLIMLGILSFMLMSGAGAAIVAGFLFIGIGAFLSWRNVQYNKETYPPLYDTWSHSWLCNKCGSIFIQKLN